MLRHIRFSMCYIYSEIHLNRTLPTRSTTTTTATKLIRLTDQMPEPKRLKLCTLALLGCLLKNLKRVMVRDGICGVSVDTSKKLL